MQLLKPVTTSARVTRNVAYVASSRPVAPRRPYGVVQAAAVEASNELTSAMDEVMDELDVPISAAALPMAGEKARLRIRMRSYEVDLLQNCIAQIEAVAYATGAVFRGPVMLPTKKRIYCVLRSPHVDKNAREHFEVRTHHRLVDLQNLSAETVTAMMQWVPPSGVEVECSIA